MTYHVLYFGLLGDRRGLPEESVASSAITADDLYAELESCHQLGLDPSAVRAAVNDVYVPWNHPLADGDTIAFLPPMSGG
jgi:molybdopterin converting factor small subunit